MIGENNNKIQYKFAPPLDLLNDCRLYSQLLTNRINKNNCNGNDDDSDNNDDNDIECDDNNTNHSSKGLLLIHVCGDDHWLNFVRQQIQSTGDFDEYKIKTNNHYSDDYHNNDDDVKDDDNNNFYKSTILSFTTKTN